MEVNTKLCSFGLQLSKAKMGTKKQNARVEEIQSKLDKIATSEMDKWLAITYGKCYGACYLFSDLNNDDSRAFYMQFIENKAKELGI